MKLRFEGKIWDVAGGKQDEVRKTFYHPWLELPLQEGPWRWFPSACKALRTGSSLTETHSLGVLPAIFHELSCKHQNQNLASLFLNWLISAPIFGRLPSLHYQIKRFLPNCTIGSHTTAKQVAQNCPQIMMHVTVWFAHSILIWEKKI